MLVLFIISAEELFPQLSVVKLMHVVMRRLASRSCFGALNKITWFVLHWHFLLPLLVQLFHITHIGAQLFARRRK